MKQTLSSARQKLVWSLLALVLVGIGTVSIWQKFGDERPLREESKAILSPTLFPHREPEGTVLAVYGEAPEFSLTERSGRKFSKGDLLGKPWIADFIFTSCAGQCPLMNLQMQGFQKQFPAKSGLQFASFTVDPKRDTPEVLAQYAERYGAEKDRWFFLTGPPAEINRVLNGFFLSPAEQPVMHSIRFILVDSKGKIRGYYDSSDPSSLKQLPHDVTILLKGEGA